MSTDLSRVALGRWGERRAAAEYARRGYRLVDANWSGSGGELDLVLEAPEGTLVFCEVKT
ncbi:MAG: endonuclease, partial [Actinomyces sp.]